MKTIKQQLMVALILMSIMAMGGCSSSPVSSGTDELDAAIRDTSNYLNASIPAKSKIVILNIQSDSPDLSDYIIDELIANAVNDRNFSVVDRQQLDAIRAEQNFQWSGEVADDQALDIGRFLGAQTIVSGAISRLGSGYRIRIRALEVQTALVQGQFNRNITASPLVADLLGSPGAAIASSSGTGSSQRTITIVNNTGESVAIAGMRPSGSASNIDWQILINLSDSPLANGASRTFNIPRETNTSVRQILVLAGSSETGYGKDNLTITPGMTITFTQSDRVGQAAQQTQPAQTIPAPTQTTPAVRTYRIGDTGPAGGIIFYDKGNNLQGWRYLEAAPVDAETSAQWSVRDTIIENTQEGIGNGRRNTQLIIEAFSRASGEWDTAAQYCDDLVFGGFDDWFLPSRVELDLMYGNLKRRNFGDFKNEIYCSSTLIDFFGSLLTSAQNLSNGTIDSYSKTSVYYVRPFRQVAGPN